MKSRTRSRKKDWRSVRSKSTRRSLLANRPASFQIGLGRSHREGQDRWLISTRSAPKRAPGWRPIARPKCARRCASEKDACWGGRQLRISESPAQKQWLDVMAARGWTVPDWPSAYGGGGLSAAETKVLKEEMAAIGAPLAADQLRHFDARPGVAQVRHRGAEEALPAGRSRAARSAGARAIRSPARAATSPGCRPRPRITGDHYLVNGQKVWTSYADEADWIFCLVRTSSESQAQRDQLPAVRHGKPRRLDQADPADQRQFALLRDLLRRCEGAQGPGRRRGEQGLGRRQISARPRARDDQRHGTRRRAEGARRGARRDRRSAAARRDRRVRRRCAGLRGDERAVHRPAEGGRGASGYADR